VALNKIAWYPAIVDTNNQTTYLEGTDIQATLNSTVKVLNSGIILPALPPTDTGQMNNNTDTGIAAEPSITPEISPTTLTTETTNVTGSPTEALTVPDDQGIAQEPEGTTAEPLGPPFPPVSSFTVEFEEPGLYPYFCAIHPWMTGQVLVRGDAQTEPGTQPSANGTTTTTTTSSNATTSDTQDVPLSDTDAEAPTQTPPSADTESPNPIFG
jgi:hypothetical protein